MQECWAGDPSKRPLLGDVEPRLLEIMQTDGKRRREKQQEREMVQEVRQQQAIKAEDLNDEDCKVDSAVDATEQIGCIG